MTTLGDPFSIPKLQRHFEKKSVNFLLKHQLYDCMINFLKSAQPSFGPICNLSQDKLVVF
jgi:hypothetical protein